MRISRESLQREAAATGFRAEILEKVIHLFSLLDGFQRHPFLQGKWALKGGTALNLFWFDVPRLSVDIDLNYIGEVEREAMLADRPERRSRRCAPASNSRSRAFPPNTPAANGGCATRAEWVVVAIWRLT